MKSEKLKELVQLRKAIRIRPKFATDQTIYGFPLVVTDQFMLLHEIHDFHLNGYTIIPLPKLFAVRSGGRERTLERILAEEKVLDKVGCPYNLNMDSFHGIFKSIQALAKNVIVETVEVDGNMLDERYMIGKIVGMSARSVAIMNFDDTGKWDTEPTILAYKQIKWVTFDSEYINTFSKYLT